MRRGRVNGIGQGLHGDVTTTGAVCISSLPNATQGGSLGVLRLGDKTTPCPLCGKVGVIVDSLPAMKWMGIPTVLHGAQVHCDCPTGRNRLIAPVEQRSSASRSDKIRAFAQPSTPATTSQATEPHQSSLTPTPLNPAPAETKQEPAVCNHSDQMEELANYIAGEMNRNIHDPAVLKMKELINYDTNKAAAEFLKLPWYARLAGPPDFNTIAWTNKLEAMVIWTKKVGQYMEWDHKPKLRKLFPGVRHKQGKYDYYYDIWSNIHYGYVGIIGGLSESVLLDGAGAEQIVSDSGRKAEEMWRKPKEEWELPGPHLTTSLSDGLRAFDDAPDRVSISIGVKLANHHPHGGITAKMVMDEVLAVAPENWGDGIRVHECN